MTWFHFVPLVLVAVASAPAAAQTDQVRTELAAAVREGFASLDQSKLADARAKFDAASRTAREIGDRQIEADALRGLGVVLYQQGKWTEAPKPLGDALHLYRAIGDTLGEAKTLDTLGSTAAMTRNTKESLASYQSAIDIFAGTGQRIDQARTIRNMSHLQEIPVARKFEMLEQAFTLADGDRRLQGLVLHSIGSMLQMQAKYGDALERLERARVLLEGTGTPREIARLMSSLGGSYHLHGQSAKAIEVYLEALRLLEAIGDAAGQSQTLTILGEAYAATGQARKALDARERALAFARRTGSPGMIATSAAQLGQAYVGLGEFTRAIAIMEEALDRDQYSDVTTGFYRHLARAYAGVGRHDDAIAMATRGVDLAKAKGRTQIVMGSYQVRSMVYEKMGRLDKALEDAQAGLQALEELRLNLAPDDYRKSGFAHDFQSLFAQTISLLDKTGRMSEAVAVAEQARARAFLDLLVSRQAGSSRQDPAPARSPAPVAQPAAHSTTANAALTLRGGASDVLAIPIEVRSGASAPPPGAATLQQQAARMHSTLVSYWVADEATFVWVVCPTGVVTARRVAVKRSRLRRLIRQTGLLSDTTLTQRGREEEEDTENAEPPARRFPPFLVKALESVTLRGGSSLAATAPDLGPFHELYDILIQPIRTALPTTPGALLTIIPHGPLFELSFAALADPRGRFLLEDFRLHYAPSAAVLEITSRRRPPSAESSGRYLFVANPTTAPGLSAQRLPSLPGAEREVRAVRAHVGGHITSLVGGAATELAIRSAVNGYQVVHFATHGLVSSERPFDSFLALAPGGDKATDDAGNDGRLTAAEIYGLELQADLVVLSACRAAGGRASGDGIVGLTRAFFSAGTPSILAALWDLADESAEHLLPRFYAEWKTSGNKSQALRAAQLTLLRDLRAGKISVNTPLGALPLPPHPALWANLVLLGEPQ